MADQVAGQAAAEGEPGQPSAAEVDLDGLAEAWEDDKTIRSVVLHKGSLCSWPNVASTGVITFETMKMNAKVIMKILEVWCPKTLHPQTVYIDHMRAQDGVVETTWHNSTCHVIQTLT